MPIILTAKVGMENVLCGVGLTETTHPRGMSPLVSPQSWVGLGQEERCKDLKLKHIYCTMRFISFNFFLQ